MVAKITNATTNLGEPFLSLAANQHALWFVDWASGTVLTGYKLERSLRDMSMDEPDREPREREKVPSLAEILEKTRAAFADVPEEELDREIDKAIAAARQEMAAEREARERKRRASS